MVTTFSLSTIHIKTKITGINSKLLYEKGNYDKLNDYFITINWINEFSNLNANDSYNKWLSIYQSGCDMFIPRLKMKSSKRIKDPLWMNSSLKSLCKRKRNLWVKCRNSKFCNNLMIKEYKELNQTIKKNGEVKY